MAGVFVIIFFGVKLHGHSGVTKKFPILNGFSRGWLRGTTVVSSGSPTTPQNTKNPIFGVSC